MAPRSIAALSLTFGLVSIPVKLYSATESLTAIRFKWMAANGARLRQQYVADRASSGSAPLQPIASAEATHPAGPTVVAADEPAGRAEASVASRSCAPEETPSTWFVEEAVVERSTMLKGYEYEKGKFVLFTPEELRALEAASRKTIDIVSFIPVEAIDPIYYDKAYFLAPDKGGAKPYHLLVRAMRDTQRCALAKWAFRAKEYVAQVRAGESGLVLQQLLYADEVRSMDKLRIEPAVIRDEELGLAKALIGQISVDTYNPAEFVDEEKQRIRAAVADKVAGKQMTPPKETVRGAKVIDLMAALRASLQARGGSSSEEQASRSASVERKPAKKATAQRAAAKLPRQRKA